MGSSWRRLKIYYINNVRLPRLLSIIGGIAIVYLVVKFLFPSDSSSSYSEYSDNKAEIKDVLDSLLDTRPLHCRDKGFDFTRLDVQETISILTEFHNKQFFDLQLTLTSIVEHTPYDLYKEIVIIDDGSTDDKIRKEMVRFIQNPRFNKAKLYRSDTRDGQSATRFKAAQLSTGSVLVYVDCSTVVNHGWLQPLISHIVQNQRSIIVPHADNLLSGHRFARTEDLLVPIFTSTLTSQFTPVEVSSSSKADLIDAPTLRGNVLAVKKNFLVEIGSFDEHFKPPQTNDAESEIGEGHHVDLSLRAWLCGGGVKVATCSRVATHHAMRPLRITVASNYRRVVELWLQNQKEALYRQGEISDNPTENENHLISIRRSYMRQLENQGLDCKSSKWYFDNVAKQVKIPSSRVRHFGKLKTKTNFCLHVSKNTWDLEMVPCKQFIYHLPMMFELNTERQVIAAQSTGISKTGMIESTCMIPEEGRGGQVRLEHCVEGDDRQRWKFSGNRLKYRTLDGDKCLSQVSRRESVTSEIFHVAQLTSCLDDSFSEELVKQQTWEFVHF